MYRIFVYGTLMNGFSNHFYLNNARFVGKGFTSKKYHMTASMIPFVSSRESSNSNYIFGEVYEVDEVDLRKVDQLEGHPHWYERKEIDVRLDDGSVMKCWMYFNEDQSGHTEIESGNYYLWRFSNENSKRMISYD